MDFKQFSVEAGFSKSFTVGKSRGIPTSRDRAQLPASQIERFSDLPLYDTKIMAKCHALARTGFLSSFSFLSCSHLFQTRRDRVPPPPGATRRRRRQRKIRDRRRRLWPPSSPLPSPPHVESISSAPPSNSRSQADALAATTGSGNSGRHPSHPSLPKSLPPYPGSIPWRRESRGRLLSRQPITSISQVRRSGHDLLRASDGAASSSCLRLGLVVLRPSTAASSQLRHLDGAVQPMFAAASSPTYS